MAVKQSVLFFARFILSASDLNKLYTHHELEALRAAVSVSPRIEEVSG